MEGERAVIWSQRGATRESNMTVASLNHLYMDTSFTTGPVQCDPETCEIMRKTINFKDIKGLDDSLQVRSPGAFAGGLDADPFISFSLVQIHDGRGWEWMEWAFPSPHVLSLVGSQVRPRRMPLRNHTDHFPFLQIHRLPRVVCRSRPTLGPVRRSLARSSNHPSDASRSYVPIKVDYSDLYDTLAFFIGTPEGQGGHDSLAEKIGENGRVWAQEYWRTVDMACAPLYLFPGLGGC